MENLDGAAKNWYKVKQDWNNVRQAWKVEHATQKGWTHQYMQRCRTMCRVGPVLSAHIIGIAFPLALTIVAGAAFALGG